MSSQVFGEAGNTVLLMGNEAIARGAVEAGVQLVAAYPGTPSSEIGEVLLDGSRDHDFYCEWSTNEKVAFELAAGASLVGARSMTAMKNAGLNVAMDTFMTLPYTGCKGGFVVVVADDPAAHYSSTEQDTRLIAQYAEIPCLEPCDQQEAKSMAEKAFGISESLELPVFLRSVSRISHASGNVKLGHVDKDRNEIAFNKHYKIASRWNVYGPPGTLSRHIWLKNLYSAAKEISETSCFNDLKKKENARTAVIASGLGASYAREAVNELGLENTVTFLKLGFIHPLPEKLVASAIENVDRIIIVEEGDPVIENEVRVLAKELNSKAQIFGKRFGGIFNAYGELNTDLVIHAFEELFNIVPCIDNKKDERTKYKALVSPRSSALCAGCSHLGSYAAIKEALKSFSGVHIVNGDIGCYEQGGYGIFSSKIEASSENSKKYSISSPYETLDTIYAMGSGIGMAIGQAKAGYDKGKVLAVAGDSTFLHATLPALIDAVYDHADITFIILNNYWTCMTGHQQNPNTLYSPYGETLPGFDIVGVCKAIGVRHIEKASSYDREEAVKAVKGAVEYEGPSVVVMSDECKLQLSRRVKKRSVKTHIDQEKCNGCKRCVSLGCPAVIYDNFAKRSSIDRINCIDCGLCSQYCPQGAIGTEDDEHGI